MRVHLVLIALIGVFLLVAIGNAALIPDQNSTISSSAANSWTVVNQQSIISVYAYNSTNLTSVSGATVTWALNTTTLGSLGTTVSTTDASGLASATFTAGTIPGTVNITATIGAVRKTYTLNIDHGVAANVASYYLPIVPVDTETPFNLSFTDKYGNPIDNRNPYDPHIITLWISASSDNKAAFDINGSYVQTPNLLLDPNGNISVNVLTDITAGENSIYLSPFGNIGGNWGVPYVITGVNNGKAFSITQVVVPASLSVPANNTQRFTFNDTLCDQFGNPIPDQNVSVQSDWPGDIGQNFTTNSFGQVIFSYGPHSMSGFITITTTALTNTSVSASTMVEFSSTAPTNMKFTATPQVMPSLDVKPGTQTAQLNAKVIDDYGNPVPGQTVTFSMGDPVYTYPNSSLAGPQLSNNLAVTDSNGNAIVTFTPGKFDTNKGNISYDPTDTGSVVVTATWTNNSITVKQPIELMWKNYPYLSETATVSPQNVPVNGTFTVTISLTADGYNVTGTPADIVIVTDLAGGIGGPELLAQTKPAEINFINNATDDTYISLVTFGNSPVTSGTPYASTDTQNLWAKQKTNPSLKLFNPYQNVWDKDMVDPAYWNGIGNGGNGNGKYCWDDTQYCTNATNGGVPSNVYYSNPYSDAKIEAHLMNAGPTYKATNRLTLTNTVTGYVSAGGTDYAAGINGAIQELNANGNPTHNQTIIMMGDGINMMAPVSHTGSEALESYWPSDWYPRSNLGWFDESDIGKAAAVDAATRAKNQGITIYGIGFSTPNSIVSKNESDMPFFTTLMSTDCPSPGCFYDDTIGSKNITQIFSQIEGQLQNTAGVDTTMTLNLQNVNVTYDNQTNMTPGSKVFKYVPSTLITNQTDLSGIPVPEDQTSEWNATNSLSFDIGTMTTGQTWKATFTMQMLTAGEVDLFNQSSISYSNGEPPLPLNPLIIYGGGNDTQTSFSQSLISISDFQVTPNTTITNHVPLQWNITYPYIPGDLQYPGTEYLYYGTQDQKGIPSTFIYSQPINQGWNNQSQTYDWDVSNLPSGTYSVMVLASGPNTVDQIINGITLGMSQKAYIKLQ